MATCSLYNVTHAIIMYLAYTNPTDLLIVIEKNCVMSQPIEILTQQHMRSATSQISLPWGLHQVFVHYSFF